MLEIPCVGFLDLTRRRHIHVADAEDRAGSGFGGGWPAWVGLELYPDRVIRMARPGTELATRVGKHRQGA